MKAKSSKDIMHVTEYRKKRGGLSLCLHCSGKDPLTKANKVFVKTYAVPPEIKGVKEVEAYRLKVQLEWQAEVGRMTNTLTARKAAPINFCDYAEGWVEKLRDKPEGYSHYLTCKGNLKVFREKLGLYNLDGITLSVVKNFCGWLCKRTYKKEKTTVVKSLADVIASKKFTYRKVAEESGISHATLLVALEVGCNVKKYTAESVCRYLGVPLKEYFSCERQEVPYSKSANASLKIMLNNVLKSAVMEELIPINYASGVYQHTITGTVGEKEILDDTEDIRRFIQCALAEKDPRKKVAFGIYIFLGLRTAELSGLEWSDIDFELGAVSISRNTRYYGKEFGIKTKKPKTKTSERTLSVPNTLMEIFREYKAWWDIEKVNHGDLWENTNRLFCQNNGKDMDGSTVATWLRNFLAQNRIKRVTPHSLRHTNITLQIANGVDIKTVSARAGHADVLTTLNIYTHHTTKADREAANKLDDILMLAQN